MSDLLLTEIRATKPEAPSALRDRVRAIAVQEPVRAPFLSTSRWRLEWPRLDWRRLVLVAPAALVVAVIAGSVIGLTRDDVVNGGGGDQAAGSAPSSGASEEAARGIPLTEATTTDRDVLKGFTAPPTTADSAVVPPVPGQLQRYEAELRLRVDDVEGLSDATKRAQRIAQQHGGSVASLQYDAPSEGVGAAQITLRVPTARVQSAMSQLSQLGTILGQRYGIEDLQQQADQLQSQIEAAQRQIAGIQAQLRSASLSDADRAVLKSRLANAQQKLRDLRAGLSGTRAEARTATLYLTLTTEEIEPEAVGGSRLDDVKDVLAWEAIALLYVLVVAGPFVILGLLVWLALRLRRRQVETRLLEQN